MSNSIITVENLGKRYRIQHQRERYTALRDVIAEKTIGFFKKLKTGNGLPPDLPPTTSDLSVSANRQSGSDQHFSVSRASTEEFWALRNINFEVKRGEVLGIIGRNGAGKTTLLKILSRITEPTEGRVRIKGRVASLLEVGTGFHPELTGRENIFLNGAILGMSKAEIRKKFDEIVAFAETEKFLDTPVKRYSSGMYVRLAFAVAAHLEPEILVVDEVLAVGDAEFQKKCLGKMESVATREGRTVLFVSHNMSAINLLCGRVILLQGGRVALAGNSAGVTRAYLSDVSSQADDKVELQHRTAVRGNGFVIHPPAIQLASDDALFTFQVESEKAQKNIGFGIAFETADGVLVSKLAPAVTNFVIDQIDNRMQARIRLKNIRHYLAGGRYIVDAWLSIPRVEILLYAKAISSFDLPPSDPFGAGAEFNYSENGVVPLDATFEVAHASVR